MTIDVTYIYLADTRRASDTADSIEKLVQNRAGQGWTLRAMTFLPEGECCGSVHFVFAKKDKGRPKK